MGEQRQSGGRDSVNFQAQEITVSVHNGELSAAQVVDLVLQLGRANLIEMQGEARRIVDERLEQFTDDFVRRAQERGPEVLGAVQDPDVQYALFTAQRDYARRGDKEVGDTLIDLLVARCSENTGTVRALALDAAVDTVGRLTSRQLNGLTCCWAMTQLRSVANRDLDRLADWLRYSVLPFADGLPTHDSAYEHLGYAGCARIRISEVTFGYALGHAYPGLFAHGVARDGIPDNLRDVEGIFEPSPRDPSRLVVRAVFEDDVELLALAAGRPELAKEIAETLRNGVLADEIVKEMVLERVPELAPLASTWDSTLLKNLSLTSVGTALANSNWTRVTGPGAELSIWIPDDA